MIYNGKHGVHCKAGDFIKVHINGRDIKLYQYAIVERVYPIPDWEGDDEIYTVRLTNGDTTHLDYSMTQQDIILARAYNEQHRI